MRKWIRIDEQLPADGQDVFYYFGHFDEVCKGKYRKGMPENVGGEMITIADNFFIGNGFLGDDVTYWMPRKPGDVVPEAPSGEEKYKDLYHPRDKSTNELS
jgi:Protein of unknown function (DUF551)